MINAVDLFCWYKKHYPYTIALYVLIWYSVGQLVLLTIRNEFLSWLQSIIYAENDSFHKNYKIVDGL